MLPSVNCRPISPSASPRPLEEQFRDIRHSCDEGSQPGVLEDKDIEVLATTSLADWETRDGVAALTLRALCPLQHEIE
jgi:hypothetical protein